MLNTTGKRNAFISIQLKHHVPSEYSETNRVRTGYESVVAHRTGETFACTARRDGVVDSIDNDLGMIKIRYNPEPVRHLDKKFSSIVHDDIEHRRQIVISEDPNVSTFKLHEIYTFEGFRLKVVDIISPTSSVVDTHPQKTPQDLLKMMSVIHYENFTDESSYIVKTPEQLLKQKLGVCYDQVELERDYFLKWKIPFKTFFAYSGSVIENPTHTFLIYQDHGKFFWFENSWGSMRGIHGPYTSYDKAVEFVKTNLERGWKRTGVLTVQYERPVGYSTLNLNQFGESILNFHSQSTPVDNKVVIKLIPISHNPADDIDIFKFGTKFTSAAGSFVKQTIVCNVKPGDHIKRGDVLAYNSGFFELDQFDPKQVTWKHGVMANVALMEGSDTIEDSDAITTEFSKRMETSTSHLRSLQITANTIIRDVKHVGEEVQTTDLLCILEDADIGALSDTDNSAMLDLLMSLNRKSPRARYHGVISEIDMLYACPIQKMHPSLAALANKINTRKSALARAASQTHKASDYAMPAQVPIGTKYHGVEFDVDTILLMFYISEDILHGAGDKLVIGNQAKSVTASVVEKSMSTESGVKVDMIFSGRSVNNRIITSPVTIGFCNRVLERLEDVVTNLYFGEKK